MQDLVVLLLGSFCKYFPWLWSMWGSQFFPLLQFQTEVWLTLKTSSGRETKPLRFIQFCVRTIKNCELFFFHIQNLKLTVDVFQHCTARVSSFSLFPDAVGPLSEPKLNYQLLTKPAIKLADPLSKKSCIHMEITFTYIKVLVQMVPAFD